MQIENADGHGCLRRMCIDSQKRNAWYGALVDVWSHVKYSPVLRCTGSAMDGASYIADRNGNPDVFSLGRSEDGLWLRNYWARPDYRWNPGDQFAFRLRPAPDGAGLRKQKKGGE